MWCFELKGRNSVGALLVAMLIGSGCGGSPSQSDPSRSNSSEGSSSDQSRTAKTRQGGYHVTYIPKPDPIPMNEHFSVEVSIALNDESEPPSDLSILVDADMPAHGHGINTAPNVRALGGGRFVVEGLLFHMRGEWELYVDVRLGLVQERAIFPLTMK